jgi:hypothetical protein
MDLYEEGCLRVHHMLRHMSCHRRKRNKMKTQNYHTVGTVLKYNGKIVPEANRHHNTQLRDHSFSWLGTDTSI